MSSMKHYFKTVKIIYLKSFLRKQHLYHSRWNPDNSECWDFLLDVVKQSLLSLNYETTLSSQHFCSFYVNKGLDKWLEAS